MNVFSKVGINMNMKKAIIAGLIILVVATAGWAAYKNLPPVEGGKTPGGNEIASGDIADLRTRQIFLYYYNPENDKDGSGNIMCSPAGLVAVSRQIPITQTPIQDAVNLLMEGKLLDEEIAAGITTEFPLAGVELKGANLKEGILTLEFVDPQNKTGGGACRAGIVWSQIEATAKQFPGVNEVRYLPETLFQP